MHVVRWHIDYVEGGGVFVRRRPDNRFRYFSEGVTPSERTMTWCGSVFWPSTSVIFSLSLAGLGRVHVPGVRHLVSSALLSDCLAKEPARPVRSVVTNHVKKTGQVGQALRSTDFCSTRPDGKADSLCRTRLRLRCPPRESARGHGIRARAAQVEGFARKKYTDLSWRSSLRLVTSSGRKSAGLKVGNKPKIFSFMVLLFLGFR